MMVLSVSNLAWDAPARDDVVESLLTRRGVRNVELAPTKIWPDLDMATSANVRDYRGWWQERGVSICALQSLLYGRPELRLFDGPSTRAEMRRHLRRVFSIAAGLGAPVLVFGSPGNRRLDTADSAQARRTAVQWFRETGQDAADEGVVLCIEANPAEYGCDFITTAAEARELVDEVDHPGFGLHLDLGGLLLTNHASLEHEIHASRGAVRHFHISEPHLEVLSQVDAHRRAASALRAINYAGAVSIEMRATTPNTAELDALDRALSIASSAYETEPTS